MTTERGYDNLHNEGGEGYNPIREARLAREAAERKATPETLGEREYRLMRELERIDSSIMRDSHLYDRARVDAINAELARIAAEREAAFRALWTPEVTEARLAAWKAWQVESGLLKATPTRQAKMIWAHESEAGHSVTDLQRAIKINKEANSVVAS